MSPPRRSQVERREDSVGRLLRATVEVLAESGYSGASTAAICQRAGLSQGGLFRHFDTRSALIVAATEQVGRAHVAAIEQLRAEEGAGSWSIAALLRLAREITRAPSHAAWHEVMVAARTDPALRDAVRPVLARYEAALHGLARGLLPADHPDPEGAEVLVLSILHAFDSEAVTRRVHASPDVEERRLAWAVATLERELGRGAGPDPDLSPPTPSSRSRTRAAPPDRARDPNRTA